MKKALCLFTFLFIIFGFNNANSQSFSVFNCDGSKHPTVKAKFFAFDAEGNQITGLSPADFTVTENGIPRTVTNVSCPEQKPKQPLSIALGIDISKSMVPWDLGKQFTRALCKYLAMPPSEMALQVCSNRAFIVQDFTTDNSEITSMLYIADDGYYDDKTGQLLNWDSGLLNIAKTGKNKRIAVLFTDGWPGFINTGKFENWLGMADTLLQACIDTCAKNNIHFYTVLSRWSGVIPVQLTGSFYKICNASGGYYYDRASDSIAADDVAKRLILQAQSGDPCEIEWQSYPVCESKLVDVQINLKKNNSVANVKYHPAYYRLARLDFSPITVKFLYAVPGIQRDTTITVTAINADYSVSNITCSNPAFSISPTNFFLKVGESRNLRISFLPIDSCYTYTKFTFANDYCPRDYYASGGFPGIKPKIPTIKLIEPNGGQEFVAGIDTIITWEGVPPDEMVKLEYSTNNGVDWIQISNNASGLSYRWKVPKTPSKVCLVRVTANGGFPEVNICNQKWMGYNLDIEHYRNGDLIPEVKDSTEWANLQTGAWCYFDNDPINGAIYGKLYNQWAVFDSRGFAPLGWRIPSQGLSEEYPGDWYALVECLGGREVAGGKLKSTGNTREGSGLWKYPNSDATNESGFTGLPGGYRDSKGLFSGAIGMGGYWWAIGGRFSLHYYPGDFWLSGTSGNGKSVRCIRDTAEAYYQSDVSDAVFAIVVPEATSKDIDMKKCLVGGVKDSLIADVIRNTGSYKFRVDSVYFSGGDESAFSITSEFEKCELAPGETKAMKFVFLPNRVGIHNSTINIVTQCDTLKQNIQGEGVEQQIEIVSNYLNFGTVQIGKETTFQDTTLIKNISNSPLDITNVVQLGPDKTQFEILGGGGAFTLQPNETRKLTVRFKPIYNGRTSGQIGFEYAGIGSPATVQLFGNGIGGLKVTIKNDSAYAGQVRRLKLVMSNVKPEDISATAPNFSAKIRFQKTILTPIKKADRNIVNDSIYMNIKGTIGTNVELAQIPVMAGLGIVSETSIDIVDFTLTNSAGEKVDYDIETTSGKFKLLGVCEEGGKRLFNSAGKVEIMQIIPNPASDNVEININLIEDGATTLCVYNYNGTKLLEIALQGETGLRTINLDTRNFDNGLYFIKLQTPTVITNQKLMIIR